MSEPENVPQPSDESSPEVSSGEPEELTLSEGASQTDKLARWITEWKNVLIPLGVLAVVGMFLIGMTYDYTKRLADERDGLKNYEEKFYYFYTETRLANRRADRAHLALDDLWDHCQVDERLKTDAVDPARRALLQQGLRYYQSFIQQWAEDPDVTADLVQSYIRSAFLHAELGEREKALDILQSVQALSEQLLKQLQKSKHQNTHATMRKLADSCILLANLQVADGQFKQAQATSERALVALKALDQAKLDEAKEREERGREPIPDSPDYVKRLAGTYRRLGSIQTELGQSEKAGTSFQQARALFEKLPREEAEYPTVQTDLVQLHVGLGDLKLRNNFKDEALREYQEAVQLCEKNQAKHPDNQRWQTEVAGVLMKVGQAQEKLGKNDEAQKTFQQALEKQQVAFQATPGAGHRRALSDHYANLARFHREAGRITEAAAATAQRQPLWAKDGPGLFGVARDLAALVPKAKEAEQKKYADQAVELLKQAVANGYRNLDELKQAPELAPLQARDDVKKLVTDLEAKLKAERTPEDKPMPKADGKLDGKLELKPPAK